MILQQINIGIKHERAGEVKLTMDRTNHPNAINKYVSVCVCVAYEKNFIILTINL